MVRIWGGGYYETQQFYEICDELGIMVWQDFMFGNPWQPGNYAFKQNVAQEVTDQLKRLRNHPSIVLWCGNNEQENNFLQDSIHVTPIARLQMWTNYLTVFSGIIPTLVARYDPAAPYWPSSPSGKSTLRRRTRTTGCWKMGMMSAATSSSATPMTIRSGLPST